MALLKKLFNKDSQEVKEFWKAFTKLYKKVNQKNLDAFLAAQKACPGIWQIIRAMREFRRFRDWI